MNNIVKGAMWILAAAAVILEYAVPALIRRRAGKENAAKAVRRCKLSALALALTAFAAVLVEVSQDL